MKFAKKNHLLFTALIISLVMGLFCNYQYKHSPEKSLSKNRFRSELLAKEKSATITLQNICNTITYKSVDSVINCNFSEKEISYFIYDDKNLIFWSDNHLDPSYITSYDSINWKYNLLSNAHCIVKSIRSGSKIILAAIIIKYQYPYENKDLINGFARGFNFDKNIEIIQGSARDKNAIFDVKNNYLFTISNSGVKVFNHFWGFTGFIFDLISVLIILFMYSNFPKLFNKKRLNLRQFSAIFILGGIITGLSLYFSFPTFIYWDYLFSSFEYSSNSILTSIGHLTILTSFVFASIYLFFFFTYLGNNAKISKGVVFQLLYHLDFLLVFYFLISVVNHSSIQIPILEFSDFTFLGIWSHLLIYIWGVGILLLFYKSHNWMFGKHLKQQAIIIDLIIIILISILLFTFSKQVLPDFLISVTAITTILYLPYFFVKRRYNFRFLFLWVLAYTLFFTLSIYIENLEKNKTKYRVIAENIYINGNTESDRMADVLLEELNTQFIHDKVLRNLSTVSDSAQKINRYLNENYLRGFWSKYEMRLSVTFVNSSLSKQYQDFIDRDGSKLRNTNFYSIPASLNSMSYLGIFKTKSIENDSLLLYMEFYQRKNFKSYSFPNLLISTTPDIKSQLKIEVAKYYNGRLSYASVNSVFPAFSDWIPDIRSEYYSVRYKNRTYYIYNPGKVNPIVITNSEEHSMMDYALYFAYTFLIFYVVSWLLWWLYNKKNRKTKFHIGLTSKFQYTYISLLIFSFLGIFYVSVNFIQQKYKDEQIQQIENKKNYIQKALQEMYYWNQDLYTVNPQRLNFDLQELSYMYQTDIHVYDNNGALIGSSQPLIFNKNLISRLISPKPFFTQNININQNEHIGALNYLTGYTNFYNGDYLQLGYIAVPQFLSQEEIQKEIEAFLSVIIHIYFIIIVLAIFLSIFIGRQLSAPLKMIENKLKQMRFGHTNEKIDYQLNDEIGQLVTQYNKTIDELEKSAKLLAQSERESAWKTMARQIAHEINNPLTPMKLTIQQLQRTKKLDDGRFNDYFEKSAITLIEQIDNLSHIAGTFSNFARMPEAHFERVDIAARLSSVVQLFISNNESVELKYICNEKEIFIYADAEQLVQVFNNLLKNALQAIPNDKNGKIEVVMKVGEDKAIIEITDNGNGISEENRDKLFIPNFTTKSGGMGLGLSIAKNIIEITGGSIHFHTRINEGTTFVITFPIAN